MTDNWFGRAAMAAIIVAIVASWFPFWKSATLSPASIQRRVYWSCTGAAALLAFCAALPDWPDGLFVAGAMTICLVVIAFAYTGMIKIGGTTFAFLEVHREPDPPPALAEDDD